MNLDLIRPRPSRTRPLARQSLRDNDLCLVHSIYLTIRHSCHKFEVGGSNRCGWISSPSRPRRPLPPAQTAAEKADHPEVTPEHLLQALLEQEGGVVPAALGKLGANAGAIRQEVERVLAALPHTQGAATQLSPRLDARAEEGACARRRRSRTSTSRPSTSCSASSTARTPSAEILKRHGVSRDAVLNVAARDPRQPARRRSQRRGPLPGAREVRARPHRAGAQGQARSRHRPRRGSAPRGAGAVPPHQEQPRAHRRAGRRQDRDRRGPGPAHRVRRRAGVAEEQAAGGARPGRAHRRAPSTAASSRTA